MRSSPVNHRKHKAPAASSRHPTANRSKPPAPAPETLQALLEGLDVGAAMATPEGTLVYGNPRFAEMIGGACRNLAGRRLQDCVAAESWPELDTAFSHVKEHSVRGEIRVHANDHEEVIRLTFTYMDFAHLVRITATRVTELIEAIKALETSQASVQSLSARILRVQDEERRRMARDLHDNTGQELAALSMTLDRAAQPGADVAEAIKTSRDLARQIESEVRTVSYLLHPPLLDEVGLGAAIGWFVDGLSKRTGIDVKLEFPAAPAGEFPRFSWSQETTLFRVVQEALGNVMRHSGSQNARVRLSLKDDNIRLIIEDSGKGMTPGQLAAAREGSAMGVGIGGMRERLKQLGGNLEIESKSDGTRVIATMPTVEPQAAPAPAREQPSEKPAEISSAPPRPAVDKKRILIVDDHEVTRQGIRSLLAKENDLEVCGEAEDGFDALGKVEELQPDLIILDLAMPRQGGLATLHHIRKTGNQVKAIVFSTHSFPNLVEILQTGGCQGYVEKSHASKDLVRAIREVLSGKPFYRPNLGKARTA